MMRPFPSFPKIFTFGGSNAPDILDAGGPGGPVEVTEKVDGSQFAFGLLDGQLRVRSKGVEMSPEYPEKMFARGVNYVASLGLPCNIIFYAEYLKDPKHNVLAYDRAPQNHLVLFGAINEDGTAEASHSRLRQWAEELGIDVAPVLYSGPSGGLSSGSLNEFLDLESFLGGAQVEGVVIKSYVPWFWDAANKEYPLRAAKLVSERFKERHKSTWKREHTKGGKWGAFVESFRSEARWEKAVQHLRDSGLLEGSPKDIGALIKEVHRDIEEEEKEAIMGFLWREYGRDVLRKSTAGLPEWYKGRLAQ